MKDENLQEFPLGYVYFQHTEYPLRIDLKQSEDYIKVIVIKLYKGKEVKRLTKSSKVINKMSIEQVEDYILDVVYLFLDGKKDK